MNKFREYFKQYLYYGIIAALVTIALVFMPLIDSSSSLNWGIPSTPVGWVAYIFLRGIIGVITFLIFISFDEQGKVNILEDERYKTAYQKLYSTRDKKYIPMSPTRYKIKTRGLKGVTLALSMIAGGLIIVECSLSYNYTILMAYGITIFMSLITGIFQMMKSSNYWTEEFPLWVDYHLEQIEAENAKEKAVQTTKEEITDGNKN